MPPDNLLKPMPPIDSVATPAAEPEDGSGSASRGQGKFTGAPLHPLSGALILGLDNLLFGANVSTGGVGTVALCGIGFGAAFAGVFLIQKYGSGDSLGRCLTKGLFAGAITGIPTPITGTLIGSLVLILSGKSLLSGDKGK